MHDGDGYHERSDNHEEPGFGRNGDDQMGDPASEEKAVKDESEHGQDALLKTIMRGWQGQGRQVGSGISPKPKPGRHIIEQARKAQGMV
jgi:hypothetical protein